MNYFEIGNDLFFLGKLLGKKKKTTLLNWIRYQSETGDASFIYEDHVKIAYKKDQDQYPFPITSNRGHILISKEAFDKWEKKFSKEVLEENHIMNLDPEKVRIERYIRNVVDVTILNELQAIIESRRVEIEPSNVTKLSGDNQSKQKRSRILKRISPTLISPLNL